MVLHDAISQIDILTNPENTSVCPGDTAMFEVTVSMDTDSVRWQYGSSSTGPWLPLSFDVNGVETTILTVFNSQFYNQKFFRIVALEGGMVEDSSTSASLIQRIPPIPVIDPTNPIFCMGQTETLFAVVNPPGAYTYLWSTSSTADSIIVTSSGLYFVTVTDEYGCFGIDSTDVLVKLNPEPIVLPPVPHKICTMGDDTIKLSTNIQYDSYIWSTTETAPTIVVSQPGAVSITVTEDGCSGSASITVTYHSVPDPFISPSMPQFCQGMDTIIAANFGFTKYAWKSGQNTREIPVNTPGLYTVTVTDNNLCEGVDSINVVQNNLPIVNIITNPPVLNNIIENSSVKFIESASPGSGDLKLWTWAFGENADIPSAVYDTEGNMTVVKYIKEGWKTVCLEVLDVNSCTNTNCLPTFYVNDIGGPFVNILVEKEAVCIGDTAKLKVTVSNSNPLDQNIVLDDTSVWEYPQAETVYFKEEPRIWEGNNKFEQYIYIAFSVPDMNYLLSVKGSQTDVVSGETFESQDSESIYGGSPKPVINQGSTVVPDFVCIGDTGVIKLFITPQRSADLLYKINGGDETRKFVSNGYLEIPVIGISTLSEIRLEIVEIQLEDGCKNENLENSNFVVEVRSNPVLIFDNPEVVCVGFIDTIYVSGADTYSWKSEGIEISTGSFVVVPSSIEQEIFYLVKGEKDGCSSESIVSTLIVAPPDPSIIDNPEVCAGQVITYKSNTNEVLNLWNVENGNILGSDTGDSVLVLWENTGKLTLIQKAGECIDSTKIDVLVNDEESPPYDTLEYLEGGGILLYPNPLLIPNLCYKWYKDGQLLPDTYQGCVVGTDLNSSELAKYSVEVTFCGQGDECAQVIYYRADEQVPVIIDFKVKVVPNPNDGIFALEYEIPNAGHYLEYIFDSSGRLVHKETIALEEKIGYLNLSLLNTDSGIYFIKLINSTTGEYRVVPFSILQ